MREILLLSIATASIAFTISETALFESFREWLKKKNHHLGKLGSCGYCLGHWVAFVLVAIYRPKVFQAVTFLDYFLTALVMAWLSAYQWAILCWLMDKAGK